MPAPFDIISLLLLFGPILIQQTIINIVATIVVTIITIVIVSNYWESSNWLVVEIILFVFYDDDFLSSYFSQAKDYIFQSYYNCKCYSILVSITFNVTQFVIVGSFGNLQMTVYLDSSLFTPNDVPFFNVTSMSKLSNDVDFIAKPLSFVVRYFL